MKVSHYKHLDVFDKNFMAQEDIEHIYSLARPTSSSPKLSTLLVKENGFTPDSLKEYLVDLGKILSTIEEPIPILLGSDDHSVCMKYDKKKNCWIYIDTNDFSRFERSTNYYRELSNEELAKSIFTSFFDTECNQSIFSTTILSARPLRNLQSQLKEFDSKYDITEEQANMKNHSQTSLLYLACLNKHPEVIKKLIEKGADINALDGSGVSLLHYFTSKGDLEAVKMLLAHGANANIIDMKSGISPLLLALEKGHFDIALMFIEKDVNIKVIDETSGQTPLHLAAENGRLDVVLALLEKGANINVGNDSNFTPLHMAAQNGHVGIVSACIKHGANIKVVDSFLGQTPLHLAVENGHANVVRVLLQNGADINAADKTGKTPLHIAVAQGRLDLVQKLMTQGADINAADKNGRTPLHLAAEKGHLNILTALLQRAAEFPRYNPIWMKISPEKLADSMEVLQETSKKHGGQPILIKSGEDIIEYGLTANKEWNLTRLDATKFESLFSNLSSGKELISMYTDEIRKEMTKGHSSNFYIRTYINAVNKSGKTPLQCITEKNNLNTNDLSLCNAFLYNGANIDINSKDKILLNASKEGHMDVIKTLFKKGDDINENILEKMTAIAEKYSKNNNEFVHLINKQKLKNYIDKVSARDPDSGFTMFGALSYKSAGAKKAAAEALFKVVYENAPDTILKQHEDAYSGGELKELHDNIRKIHK